MFAHRFAAEGIAALGIFLFCVAGPVYGASSSPPGDTTHYEIDANIHPQSGRFEVQVRMHVVPQSPTDTLRFLLHEDLVLQDLTAPLAGDYQTTPWRLGRRDSLFTTVFTLPLAREATPSDPVSLTWTYEGRLQPGRFPPFGGPTVTPHWVELPVEAMWVPVSASLRTRFTFEASLDVPEGYDLVSPGTIQKTSAGWQIESDVPTPDVPIILSDQLQSTTLRDGDLSVTLYHAGAPDSVRSYVSGRTAHLVDRYAERFRAGRETERLRMTLAPVERASNSSYARPGLIALRHNVRPDTSLYELLAHEAAHLWWTDAVNTTSRHNFLNESFAEYEAWRAVLAVYGETAFHARLDSARTRAKGAPSFYDWTPQYDGALSYNKGPLLLHRLHQRIGKENYLAFLRHLQRADVGTLSGMLEVLGTVTSPSTADWFENKL